MAAPFGGDLQLSDAVGAGGQLLLGRLLDAVPPLALFAQRCLDGCQGFGLGIGVQQSCITLSGQLFDIVVPGLATDDHATANERCQHKEDADDLADDPGRGCHDATARFARRSFHQV